MTRLARGPILPETGPDRRKCTRCLKVKPLSREFFPWIATKSRAPRFGSWCVSCLNLGMTEYRQTEAYRATRAAYLARPEVLERRREAERDRAERRKAAKRAYLRTPRGRLVNGRATARSKLRRATTEARREVLLALIALYDRELARLDAGLAGGEGGAR